MGTKFPSVNVNQYVNIIDKLGTVSRTMCVYCGNNNVPSGDMWLCAYCENANSGSMSSIKLKDTSLVNSLSIVTTAIAKNDFKTAIIEYDKIITRYGEPGYMYNYGLLHFQFSNFLVGAIRYDRKGFMEENSILREQASIVASTAKKILNRAAFMCKTDMSTGKGNDLTMYTMFIISIKLRKMKTARKAIELLNQLGNQYLTTYSEMVFNAEAGRYPELVNYATELVKKGQLSINAFYYIAWALFKDRKYADSKRILDALNKQLQNETIIALSNELEKATSSY